MSSNAGVVDNAVIPQPQRIESVFPDSPQVLNPTIPPKDQIVIVRDPPLVIPITVPNPTHAFRTVENKQGIYLQLWLRNRLGRRHRGWVTCTLIEAQMHMVKVVLCRT